MNSTLKKKMLLSKATRDVGLPTGSGFRRRIALLAAMVAGAFTAFASTWTGGGAAGDWNDSDNWSGGVPAAGGTAEFSADTTITSDVELPAGKIVIKVAAGKTLNLDGVFSGSGALDVGVAGVAAGNVNFNNTNTFTGSLGVCAGEAHAKADNAFGSAETGRVNANGGLIYVDGSGSRVVTVLRQINVDGKYHVFSDAVLGKIGFNAAPYYKVNGSVRWTGGGGANGLLWMPNVAAGGEIVIDTTPASVLPYVYTDARKVVLAVAGCDVNNFNGTGSCYSGTRIAYLIRCDVDGAFSAKSNLCFEDSNNNPLGWSCLDLNSTTQSVKRLYSQLTAEQRTVAKRLGRVTSAAGGLITINDTEDFYNCNVFEGTASFALNQAAGKTATLYGKSTSSGDLIAQSTGPVVLASGSQWAGVIRVPTGASVTVEAASGLTPSTTLWLDGGALKLPADTTIFVKAVRKTDGSTLSTGFHSASEAGIAGNNVTLGVNIPAEPQEEKLYTWVGGHGTSVQTAENWKNSSKPDFRYSGNVLNFPDRAAANFDCPASVKRLVFAGSTRLTASGNGAISLFYGKISVSAGQVEIAVPVNYYDQPGIEVTESACLKMTEKVASLVSGKSVYKWGYGDFWLKGDDNDFAGGDMVLSNGYLYVSGAAPLGGAGKLCIRDSSDLTGLTLSNAVVACAIQSQAGDGGKWRRVAGAPASTNKITGTIDFGGCWGRPNAMGNGCVLEIAGGTCKSVTMSSWVTGQGAPSPQNSTSLLRICEKPLSYLPLYFYQGSDSAYGWKTMLEIACPSNIISTESSSMPAQPPLKRYGGFFYGTRLAADDAIHPWVQLTLLGTCTRIDLGGHVQHLYNLIVPNCSADGNLPAGSRAATDKASGLTGCIYGKSGSKLVLTGTPVCGDTWDGNSQDQMPNFGGAASIERTGSGSSTFRCVNTSTGEVVVTGGSLTFAKKGDTWTYWKSATVTEVQTTPVDATWAGLCATVTGGTLNLRHTEVFPKDVAFKLDGAGRLALPEGVTRARGGLYRKEGDSWVRMPNGSYGASDNTSVPEEFRLAQITGPGTLKVGGRGFAIIVY